MECFIATKQELNPYKGANLRDYLLTAGKFTKIKRKKRKNMTQSGLPAFILLIKELACCLQQGLTHRVNAGLQACSTYC